MGCHALLQVVSIAACPADNFLWTIFLDSIYLCVCCFITVGQCEEVIPSTWRIVIWKSCGTRAELDFPCGSVMKNPPANVGDTGWIPRLRRCSGERNGNPLQYSCLRNPMGRGAWRATAPGPQGSYTT